MSSSSSSSSRSKSNANSVMTKANNQYNISLSPIYPITTSTSSSPDTPNVKNEKKKKSILPKIFGSRRNGRGSDEDALKSNPEGDSISITLKKLETKRKAFLDGPMMRKSFSERETSLGLKA
ncbi:unnamed protein product [Vicia faba]|uniref:Uncharacterized protein n=1 Tax=Vicia faba TaxID=3906 RepID=A0AAV1BBA4_VICFA|nr:unnamed protein product [Vicia faba]